MEIWWWIEPLFLTGLVCISVGWVSALLVDKAGEPDKANKIMMLFCIPLILSFLAMIAWLLCYVFSKIWEPYF